VAITNRDILEQSVTDGTGPTVATYLAAVAGMAAPMAVLKLVVEPRRHAPSSQLVVVGAIVGGLVLGVVCYLIARRLAIAIRLAKLHAIPGIDPGAADAVLGGALRRATLTVRATLDGDRDAAAAGVRSVPRVASARVDGDDLIVVTEELETTNGGSGAGARAYFSNAAAYTCVLAIARALPRCRRFAISLDGTRANPGDDARVLGGSRRAS
jgi:hypothetical protein